MQSCNEKWRKQRRLVSQNFSQSNVPKYYNIQEKAAAALILKLADDPSNFIPDLQL